LTLKLTGLAIAFGMLAACTDPGTPQQDAPVARLQTSEVSIGEVTRVINASGTVQPETTVLVGSEVSGRVLSVDVDFNSPVKAGDRLATIEIGSLSPARASGYTNQ